MEYYNLRKAGNDIDLIASKEDINRLAHEYPQSLKDLWGDFGVVIDKFEIWKTIIYKDYDWYRDDALEREDFFVVSVDKLLYMKTLAFSVSKKYKDDMILLIDYLNKRSFNDYPMLKEENNRLISDIKDIKYIEKLGD